LGGIRVVGDNLFQNNFSIGFIPKHQERKSLLEL
jgi:hypothetical protein